jgi:uracil-DNA glycosylase family 4
MSDTQTEALKAIRDEVWQLGEVPYSGKPDETPLAVIRKQTGVHAVIGEGNHSAKLMCVGEAPGRDEAKLGRPFVGAAGRILNELLTANNIPREDVYITNLIKDRPPGNRDPLPHEIELYAPFLDRQIEIIKPAVIATLGRFSMAYLMEKFGLKEYLLPISKIHGRIFEAQASYGPVKIVTLYHPAVALYNGSTKVQLIEDFKAIKELLDKA